VFCNTNPLLGHYDGVDGVKTGYETNAGRCLAVSATRNGHQVVVVVLHDDNYVRDSSALLDWTFDTFAWWSVQVPSEQTGKMIAETVVLRKDRERFLRVMTALERIDRGWAPSRSRDQGGFARAA
jgi:D-alanyl-D-alanine carboxypeptidase